MGGTGKKLRHRWLIAGGMSLLFLLLGYPVLASKGGSHEVEVYHILQHGFISVQGKSNFFDFKGEAVKHEGRLVEEEDKYTGKIILRFKDLIFNLPLVSSIITNPEYLNVEEHPVIKIDLDHFHPEKHPTQVTSTLSMNGVTRPISIATQIISETPVVKVKGSLVIKQTEFGIKPYKVGLVKVVDELDIVFMVYFCEVHKGQPDYEKTNPEAVKRYKKEDNITIISNKQFFGCEALREQFEQGLLK